MPVMPHTPGPWAKASKKWDESEIQTIVGPQGQVICQVETEVFACPSGVWVTPKEAGPNWDLIAAAPELLDALKHQTRELIRAFGQHSPPCDCAVCHHVTVALQAIAKAEGR